MDIGERIKFCRKHRGMTQDRLAEETGIHPVSIRKYETGKMVPKPEQIERIAKHNMLIFCWLDRTTEFVCGFPQSFLHRNFFF